MRNIAVTVVIFLSCNSLLAQTNDKGMEHILLQAYDSIRIEMIKTTYNIWGAKNDAFLKEISEGRIDSALVKHNENPLAQLIKQSNRNFSGTDPKNYNNLANTIRANLMGRLLIQNYKKEKDIVYRFDAHKKGLDSLFSETIDYMEAKRNNTLEHFHKKYPKSNFNKLIPYREKGKNTDDKQILLFASIAILVLLIAIIVLLIILKKKNKKMSSIQQIHKDVRQGQDEQSVASVSRECADNIDAQNTRQVDAALPQQYPNVGVSENIDNPKVSDTSFDATNINAFAEKKENCIVVGTSVIGKSHISMGLPCQDNCRYTYIKNGWGIAITSDGAGSAEHSDIGSRIVAERGIYYFRSVVEQKKWVEKEMLPTEAEWANIAYTTLKAIRDDIEKFAVTKNLNLSSLSATIIVVIHTPIGFLTTHVGDGRAGYKDDSNEWKALIAPHKGEEANQTIFMTSAFWELPYYVMSGVMVPESHVVCCRPVAFTLMSDGCEHTAWLCNKKNEETGIFYDPNKPFDRFFNPLVEQLAKSTDADLRTDWAKYISFGNESFRNESDDKTMILGVIK